MYVVEISTGVKHEVVIGLMTPKDYENITKGKYFFDWKKEREFDVYKLHIVGQDEVLGLMSLSSNDSEEWVKINLLAVSKDNRGRNKVYERIAGNLIAFACNIAVNRYGENACVTLDPKSELKRHYIDMYGMYEIANRIFLENMSLVMLLNKYDYESE